jgi:hypothetical protein
MASHDFSKSPFLLTTDQIKTATRQFKAAGEREVRILCKQDRREDRPEFFRRNGLFILPVDNRSYFLVQGEGYVDIHMPESKPTHFVSEAGFVLESSTKGDGEMQHVDFAFASGLTKSFLGVRNIHLTIRGRKRTPRFSYTVGIHGLYAESVQTEVDAGYESTDSIILLEAKNGRSTNTIIRQLYFPYRQWSLFTKKPVHILFFNHKDSVYTFWEYTFTDPNDYNSIKLVRSNSYELG